MTDARTGEEVTYWHSAVRRILIVAAALCSLAAAVVVGWAMRHTAWGTAVEDAVASTVSEWRDGVWRLLRGGLGRVVPPLLVVAIPAGLVLTHRRWGWRAAIFGALVTLGSNATVQAVKAGWVPFPDGAGPSGAPSLSGHVPLVMSAAVVAVLAAPALVRSRVAVVAVVAVMATAAGVVVSGWHTVGETVEPALVFLAWLCAAVATVVGWPGRTAHQGRSDR